MKKRKLKTWVFYSLYIAIFIFVFGSILLLNISGDVDLEEDVSYVSKTIFEDEIPVVTTNEIISKPYLDENVKVLKDYYDYTSSSDNQVNAIIYYENTYLQNSGIVYGGVESFDVVSILDGTVLSIKEDNILGTIIEIMHKDNIISVYQGVSEVSVKENDVVSKGQILAKSGLSNIEKDLGSHLHFELIVDGEIVNPNNFYDKNINEL